MKVAVRELKRRFVDHQALGGVSIEFASGELIAIVGESGCGKTTLLRIVAGLETLDEGEVRFGDDVVAAPGYSLPPEKREIGFTFQSMALWPHMTVFKNIAYGLRARRIDRQTIATEVAEALERVGLGGMGHRYPHELSGGQAQRVSLCRSLVLKPKVMLMDEPLSALDTNLRRDTGQVIRRIQSELRLTTLYVTHDMDEAMRLADRIVVMRDGRVVQTGTPREAYREPVEPFVAEFTGDVNWLHIVRRQRDASQRITLLNEHGETVARAVGGDEELGAHERFVIGVRPENVEFVADEAPLHPGRLRIAGVVDDVVPGRQLDEVIIQVPGHRFTAYGNQQTTPVGTKVQLEASFGRISVFPDHQ